MKKILFILGVLFAELFAQEVVQVPEWAKTAVWYQIFPERFRNGDATNDPTPHDLKGGWPYELPPDWQISDWTGDWYEFQSWEKNWSDDFYRVAGTRRYGGDIQGVIDKLDYLAELGITAIYFNPLFESPSLHKYDATMYRHIDNNFGPNPKLDEKIWEREIPDDPATWRWTSADSLFLRLIREAHARGMKIIIDGVFNHVGATFWAFEDVKRNGEKSKYKDWFYIKRFDDPNTPQNEFDYQGWYGVKDLPELKEDENGLIEPIKKHIFNIVKRWGDPNGDGNPEDGIDGWRLDVADMVNIRFWKEFRNAVKSVNPDAYLTGEVWWENWSENKMFNASPWLDGTTFDAVMNYRFARAIKRFVADEKLGINSRAFADSLRAQYSDYAWQNILVLMNLLDSHDTERFASITVNPDHFYDHNANPQQNPNWRVRKPNAIERAKQKLAVALQMTLPGAPMIYYGDEAGMWGGDDPDDRKPMLWKEFDYAAETHHPYGKKRPADSVKFDENLFDWYKRLIALRKKKTALSLGTIKFIESENPNSVIFLRENGNEKLLVCANKSGKEIKLELLEKEFTNARIIFGTTENPNSLAPYELKVFEVR